MRAFPNRGISATNRGSKTAHKPRRKAHVAEGEKKVISMNISPSRHLAGKNEGAEERGRVKIFYIEAVRSTAVSST